MAGASSMDGASGPGATPSKVTAADTTPAPTYDVMAFASFDLDRLKQTRLFSQDVPSRPAAAKVISQPLVFAFAALAARLSTDETKAHALPKHISKRKWRAAATARGLCALKMFHLAVAAIFLRPPGAETLTEAEMMERAKAAASGPQALLDMVEDLLAACQPLDASAAAAPAAPVGEGDSATYEPTQANRHRRSRFLARKGEWRRASQALVPTIIASSTDPTVRKLFADLNPSSGTKAAGGELTPELVVPQLNTIRENALQNSQEQKRSEAKRARTEHLTCTDPPNKLGNFPETAPLTTHPSRGLRSPRPWVTHAHNVGRHVGEWSQ